MRKRTQTVRALAVLAVLLGLAFSGMIFVTPAARADHNTVPWEVESTVTNTAGVYEQYPLILADTQGNLYVFFIAPSSGVQANLTLVKYHVGNGGGLGYLGQSRVNPTAGSVLQGYPFSATFDRNGYLYVAWTESSGFTGGLGNEVMVTRSTDGGAVWSQTTTADAPNAFGSDYSPIIVAAPDGTLSVIYLTTWGGPINVAFSHSVNGGGSFSGFTNVTDQGNGFDAYWPAFGVDSHGRLYLVYEYYNLPDLDFTLNYTWSDDGATWAAPQAFTPDPTVPSYVPKMVVDSQDNVHVAYYSWQQTPLGTNSIMYRVSRDRGATFSPQVPVNQGDQNVNTFPSLAVTGSSVMVVGAYGSGVDFAVSADGGRSFYPEESQAIAGSFYRPREAVDTNGTIWMAYEFYNGGTSTTDIGLASWHAPPTAPTITSVTAGVASLTVSWTASPETDVVEYRVYRSLDGSNYQIVGTVTPGTTSFTDSALGNGTYFYQVDAVDATGLASHTSQPASGTVGVTVQQLQNEIATLTAQLNALKSQLTTVQGNTTALQTQINALQAQITDLQNLLNNMQSQQATQTISYANLAFEVIVVVLLVVLLLNQMRKPKNPKLMMAQPGQTDPKKPEDDL